MSRREAVLDKDVLSAGGRAFTWRDVVTAARIWSDWSEIEQRARHSLGLRGLSGDQWAKEEVEQAQNDFRHQRNLLAADDMKAWLARWGVSVEDWLDQVRGAVYRRRNPSAPADPAEVDPAELEAAAWAEAVCSGELERLAQRLAERLAVHPAESPAELTPDWLSSLDDAHRRFREAAVTHDALTRRLQDERLEWTRIDGRYLAHRDEDVVREAALCVREEERDLEEMARVAGARYEPVARFYLADAGADLKPRLLAASPGELCGPFRSGDEHLLLEVGARTPPSLDDAELRARAAAEVAARALDRELLQRVRWHEQLAG